MGGLLPRALWPDLKWLDLVKNEFSGPLPDWPGLRLDYLGLASNRLEGTIPAGWAKVGGPKILDLRDNKGLTGCLPRGFERWAGRDTCDGTQLVCEVCGAGMGGGTAAAAGVRTAAERTAVEPPMVTPAAAAAAAGTSPGGGVSGEEGAVPGVGSGGGGGGGSSSSGSSNGGTGSGSNSGSSGGGGRDSSNSSSGGSSSGNGSSVSLLGAADGTSFRLLRPAERSRLPSSPALATVGPATSARPAAAAQPAARPAAGAISRLPLRIAAQPEGATGAARLP